MDMKFKNAPGLPPNLQNASDLLARKDHVAAEQALRKMIKTDPNNPVLIHLLGIAIVERGLIEEGSEMIRKSLRMRPTDANLRNNFAVVLHNHGRKEQAIAEYRRAIEINPRQVEAHANLGKLLLDKRDYVEAQRVLQRGTELDPKRVEIWNDWGVSLLKQRKLDDAEPKFRRAIEIDEKYPTAHNNLGSVLHQRGDLETAEREMCRCLQLDPKHVKACENLGRVLLDGKRCEDALAVLRKGMEIAPDSYEIHRGIGNVLHEMRRYEEALKEILIAKELRPNDGQVLVDLARVYHDMDRVDDARDTLFRARELDPESPEVHSGIGYTYFLRGMIRESLVANDEALKRDPLHVELNMARAVDLLLLGDWERGWEAYEWRHKFKNNISIPERNFGVPVWDGSPLNGRTILLHWEQGLGDSIQFCRYAPIVAQMGGKVVVEVKDVLVRLLRSLSNVEQVLSHGDPLPPFDVSCSMLSLPYVLKTRVENVPNQVPYLRAATQDVEPWKGRLGPHNRLRVAMVWSGLGSHGLNRRRSMRLATLMPILDVPNVEFYSLQMKGAEEIAQTAPGRIRDLTPDIKDFADSAAALTQMDMVISVDTSVVHLAGAMGLPVWMMLYLPSEWRWLLERTDSPWYPSMRIFRQQEALVWEPVVQEVAAQLRKMAGG